MNGWQIPFRRNFGQEEQALWLSLMTELQEISLADTPDSVSWKLEASGLFSTKSMYQALCRGPKINVTKLFWKAKVPMKIRIFTWQMARGRLPSNDQILKRGGASQGLCALCGQPENVDHIFFQLYPCPIHLCFRSDSWGSYNSYSLLYKIIEVLGLS
jgi:hypothetical protein